MADLKVDTIATSGGANPLNIADLVGKQSIGGIGQTWQAAELTNTGAVFTDGTPSYRVKGQTYVNNTGKEIEVIVQGDYTAGSFNAVWLCEIDGLIFPIGSDSSPTGNTSATGSISVPNGSSYNITAPAFALDYWLEKR